MNYSVSLRARPARVAQAIIVAQGAEIRLDPEIKINIHVPERNLVAFSQEYKLVAM